MNQEIWAMVMTKYPKLEKERTCRMEREFRNAARQEYYQKLLYERDRNSTEERS
jgi:hypothetical protein